MGENLCIFGYNSQACRGGSGTTLIFFIQPSQEVGDHQKFASDKGFCAYRQSQMHDYQKNSSGRRGDLSAAWSSVVK